MTLHSRTLDLARLGPLFSLFAVAACGHGFAAGVGAGRARFGIGGEHTARTSPLLSARAFVPEAQRAVGCSRWTCNWRRCTTLCATRR